ncbi:hypothetical protein SRABI26_03747 [Arthrobacter sp. Bi26]|nr:hypothetical protein SRABI26_03747 [Arthrobacter sp. Bi26]
MGAGKPGADHDLAGPGGQGQGDVARVADPAVGPHPAAGFPRRGGTFEDGAELRAAHGGHHARCAHGARTYADLDDVRPGLDELTGGLAGDDVAGDHRHAGVESLHGSQGVEHFLLVPVRGIEDQHVHAGRQQLGGPPGHVTVDADGGSHLEFALVVQGRPVERGAQGALAGEHTGQDSVLLHGCVVCPRSIHRLKGAAKGLHRTGSIRRDRRRSAAKRSGIQQPGVQHQRLVADDGGQRRETVLALAVGGPDNTGDSAGLIHHHDGAVRPLAHQVEGINHGVRGRERDGGLQDRVAPLDPGRDIPDDIERHVLRQDSKAAAAGHGLGHPLPRHRRHVRRHQRNRRAGPVIGGEIDVQARDDIRPRRHQEEVGVSQIGGGLIQETHGCSLCWHPQLAPSAPKGFFFDSRAVPGGTGTASGPV